MYPAKREILLTAIILFLFALLPLLLLSASPWNRTIVVEEEEGTDSIELTGQSAYLYPYFVTNSGKCYCNRLSKKIAGAVKYHENTGIHPSKAYRKNSRYYIPRTFYRCSCKRQGAIPFLPAGVRVKRKKRILKRKNIVRGIEAFSQKQNVVVIWSSLPNIKNLSFKIYRGKEPLDSKKDVQKAKLIGRVRRGVGNVHRFIDKRPVINRRVYYGVVVNDEDYADDFPGLIQGESYIRHKHTEKKLNRVRGIEAFSQGKKVLVVWSFRSRGKNTRFKIYRGDTPLNTRSDLKEAKLIGRLRGSGNLHQFTDKEPILNRFVYYGVVANNEDKSKYFRGLVEGKSYLEHKHIEKQIIKRRGIEAFNRRKTVVVVWSFRSSGKNTLFKIYRGDTPLNTRKALREAKLIGKLRGKDTNLHRFVDKQPVSNRYVYYGVTVNDEDKVKDFTGLVRRKSYIRHKYIDRSLRKTRRFENIDIYVYDLEARLTWQRCAWGQVPTVKGCRGSAEYVSYREASRYCAGLGSIRGIRWRLPETNELLLLVDPTAPKGLPRTYIDFFPNTRPDVYWVRTPYLVSPSWKVIWAVDFESGLELGYAKYERGYVRCVNDARYTF